MKLNIEEHKQKNINSSYFNNSILSLSSSYDKIFDDLSLLSFTNSYFGSKRLGLNKDMFYFSYIKQKKSAWSADIGVDEDQFTILNDISNGTFNLSKFYNFNIFNKNLKDVIK